MQLSTILIGAARTMRTAENCLASTRRWIGYQVQDTKNAALKQAMIEAKKPYDKAIKRIEEASWELVRAELAMDEAEFACDAAAVKAIAMEESARNRILDI